jgi:hypothetical protein
MRERQVTIRGASPGLCCLVVSMGILRMPRAGYQACHFHRRDGTVADDVNDVNDVNEVNVIVPGAPTWSRTPPAWSWTKPASLVPVTPAHLLVYPVAFDTPRCAVGAPATTSDHLRPLAYGVTSSWRLGAHRAYSAHPKLHRRAQRAPWRNDGLPGWLVRADDKRKNCFRIADGVQLEPYTSLQARAD